MAKSIFDQIDEAKATRADLIAGIEASITVADQAKADAIAAAEAATAAGDSDAFIAAKEAERTAEDKKAFYTSQLTSAKERTLYPAEEWEQLTESVRTATRSASAANMASIKTHLETALELAEAVKDEAVKGSKAESAIRNKAADAENGNSGFTGNAWYLLNAIKVALNNDYLKSFN